MFGKHDRQLNRNCIYFGSGLFMKNIVCEDMYTIKLHTNATLKKNIVWLIS